MTSSLLFPHSCAFIFTHGDTEEGNKAVAHSVPKHTMGEGGLEFQMCLCFGFWYFRKQPSFSDLTSLVCHRICLMASGCCEAPLYQNTANPVIFPL